MKISYRETGGFAGLHRGADLDLDSLPSAEAKRLRKLVERACLGEVEAGRRSGARDLVGYQIAVEDDDGKTFVARFDDASVPESATALVEALRKRARPIPLRKPSSRAPSPAGGSRGERSPRGDQPGRWRRGRA